MLTIFLPEFESKKRYLIYIRTEEGGSLLHNISLSTQHNTTPTHSPPPTPTHTLTHPHPHTNTHTHTDTKLRGLAMPNNIIGMSDSKLDNKIGPTKSIKARFFIYFNQFLMDFDHIFDIFVHI